MAIRRCPLPSKHPEQHQNQQEFPGECAITQERLVCQPPLWSEGMF